MYVYVYGIICLQDSPGNKIEMGSHSILQGILLTQGLNPGLLHYWQILYHLSHGKPYIYIHTHTHTHTHTHISIYIYIYPYVCVCICVCVYTHTHLISMIKPPKLHRHKSFYCTSVNYAWQVVYISFLKFHQHFFQQ